MSGLSLLRNLGYEYFDYNTAPLPKTEPPFHQDDLTLLKLEEFLYKICVNDKWWLIELKLTMTEADLHTLSHLVATLAPPYSTARLQADAHAAGNIFVGLILSFDETRIPVNLVSADIGCGLTLIPCITPTIDSTHITHSNKTEEYYSFVLACMRRSLKRGRVAEQGLTASQYLKEASLFYAADELDTWLAEMKYVLDMIGVTPSDGNILDYIGKYTQSLGSSGNHFMEMATDDYDKNWLVVHSGSRGLGAMVYQEIASACRRINIHNGCIGYEVATGKLAEFYTRAYSALNQFAKLNRVICAIAVLDDLGLETSASKLKEAMKRSEIFASAIKQSQTDESILGLLGGLTHNGLKAFVNDTDKERLFVLSKGAIVLDKRHASGIVALRAGEGCVVFTLVDPTCKWREMKLCDAIALDSYTTIYKPPKDGIVECGHGAGRTQSTTMTEKSSTFEELYQFFKENQIVANMAPGMLGDNPAKAYKDSSMILPMLPLDIAHSKSMLRTRVCHKEGMVYKKALIANCAEFVKQHYMDTELASLVMDFNLVKDGIGEEVYAIGCRNRDELMSCLEKKYRHNTIKEE
jgi:tRNA-splicing ligase RtcB